MFSGIVPICTARNTPRIRQEFWIHEPDCRYNTTFIPNFTAMYILHLID
jgi:hypothetical protein